MKHQIIIASPTVSVAEALKSQIEMNPDYKVIEIVTYLEMLIETCELYKAENRAIHGIILNTTLSRKGIDPRLELLSEVLLNIRMDDYFSETQFLILSNEKPGHPFLSELVNMGIYNILLSGDGKKSYTTQELLTYFEENHKTFADNRHLLKIDQTIDWDKRRTELAAVRKAQGLPPVVETQVEYKTETVEVIKEKIVEKVIEKQKVVEIPVTKLVAFEPKKIAVASLYPRAGSSFIAGNVAEYLAMQGVPVALAEAPTTTPYWYNYFDGVNAAPSDWKSWGKQISENGRVEKGTNWTLKSGLHLITHEELIPVENWAEEHVYKFIFTTQQVPIVIYDISHNWKEITRDILFEYADNIWVVLDFDIVQTNLASERLAKLQEIYGDKIQIIFNRCVESDKIEGRFKKEMGEPIATFPSIDHIARSAQWKYQMAVQDPEGRALLEDGLIKLGSRLVDNTLFKKEEQPWYKKVFNRNKQNENQTSETV
ncbi:hypothetical protein [Niallia taxi]|uniref:hypothetical protein n=1 Tax=Niallia taxi TaxID=2499688 RepID=UPI0015F43F14|nr:hypothetical protein [Niallia taxi]